jgi:hypothetical protein
VDVLLNNAAEISFPNRKIICERFWYGYWYRLKGTKTVHSLLKLDWYQTKVFNGVTTYAWTGSAYVVPSATAKRGSCNDQVLVEWANTESRDAIAPDLPPKELGTDWWWSCKKFDMAKVPLQRVETTRCNLAAYGFWFLCKRWSCCYRRWRMVERCWSI